MKQFKFKKTTKKIKFKNIFIVVFGIWFVDFLVTAIILNTITGFKEGNKLSAHFFSFGLPGWIFSFIASTCALCCLSILIYKTSNYFSKEGNEKAGKLAYYLGIGIVVSIEFVVITKNILLVIL